ncbi:MAG: hypothetical protein COV72_02145 [Candidatus Omnitrophica bacterium CG11_big_fil_rev_8_21_14_0_20_42_13]|uniref:Glycosyltransferase 2-like domain-containing protein n=1 Tax=Candidatus Ghiorseimicrobium undicola TaxID=1974746 RepID=A0A2H0LZ23_9BACT|nr:MAG: hypothetical protein COV72_02145 [Candidatus Omnitrophica bacterium CG11_big_fil_rev_8_21_14_0_20_42_13]
MSLSIIIPVYNEERGVASVIGQIKKAMSGLGVTYEIIVVDDGSSDKSAELAASEGAAIIRHNSNRGYGAALKTGVNKSKYGQVLILDADGSYPVKDIPLLIEKSKDSDMVVGARTGSNVNIPLLRRPAKFILNALANYLSEAKIPDLNSGFRIIKKEAILRFLHILPNGFSFTTTITLAMLVNDYRVSYVPIDYHKRTGRSKINPIKDTMNFFLLIIRTIMYFNPLKIFLPLSGFLFILGVFVFLYSYFILDRVMDVATILLVATAIQVAVIGLLADLIDKRIEK